MDIPASQEEYFRSLPFTQSSRFAMRMGVGYMIITAVSVMFGLGALLIRQAHIEDVYMGDLLSPYYRQLLGNETIWHMLRSLLVFWLCLLVIYTVCVMAHTIVANGVPGRPCEHWHPAGTQSSFVGRSQYRSEDPVLCKMERHGGKCYGRYVTGFIPQQDHGYTVHGGSVLSQVL